MHPILDTGISVVYEPSDCVPDLDIVFVHGLQGHPYKTWASDPGALTGVKTGRKRLSRQVTDLSKKFRKTFSKPDLVETDAWPALAKTEEACIIKQSYSFWPADLLPERCPGARIMLYGYDSKVTKYMSEAPNQNGVYSHGKDLLFTLGRERELNRPLVLIAHSLGGIVVKEMLAGSSTSTDPTLKNIIDYTAAVVFFATPHRGSPGLAAFGEFARTIVSGLGIKTTSAILDTLGLKTTDLQRSQEAFSALWQQYDFKVKTFQEGLGMTGVNLGVLGNKAVPDFSSIIGDQRERAETLQANHRDICRFTGNDDPNYRKVAGELQSIYESITRIKLKDTQRLSIMQRTIPVPKRLELRFRDELSPRDNAFLQTLWFPSMNIRRQNLVAPAKHTCSWLFHHKVYRGWLHGQDGERSKGLIWLKGKPGAGKSILMKEAFHQTLIQQAGSSHNAAAFYFNPKGDNLERSSEGLLRSLLYQLLTCNREFLRELSITFEASGDQGPLWSETTLRIIIRELLVRPSSNQTTIFIDELDACQNGYREEVYFWRELTESAHLAGVHLKVCLSSRYFPNITISDCPEILVDVHNYHDICQYVVQKFHLTIAKQESRWNEVKDKIIEKSDGVFLWVVMMVDRLLAMWDEGKNVSDLLTELGRVPQSLVALFTHTLQDIDSDMREQAIRFFQWVVLAIKPLRLHEWHHIMAFIEMPTASSLHDLEVAGHITKDDHELERRIRWMSRGLVEVKIWRTVAEDDENDMASIYALAGSLDLEYGGSRIVGVIHETVRQFFLDGTGFWALGQSMKVDPVGNGHLSIMATCLDYIRIAELDALIEARAHLWAIRDDNSQHTLLSSQCASAEDQSPSSRSSIEVMNHNAASTLDGSSGHGSLGGSLELSPAAGVLRWIRTNHYVADLLSVDRHHPLENEQQASSKSLISDDFPPQVLEAHPALLSYITAYLFVHARLAEGRWVPATYIIRRMLEKETWIRWALLREDVLKATDIFQYATSQGLKRWKKPTDSAETGLDTPPFSANEPKHPGELVLDIPVRNYIEHLNTVASQHRENKQVRPYTDGQSSRVEIWAPRRRDSVASFSSAGSHND